ncbi:Putative lipoprotein required for motility [hydrothermal vent metagenome]|uniref:Putative lipoprotein required for motility n=1 Tax=hydrothermal vent metagenome TaxID=652676 RepID=A0A1W1BQP2_9ZZZZ
MLLSFELLAAEEVVVNSNGTKEDVQIVEEKSSSSESVVRPLLKHNKSIVISVVGEGVAPVNTTSPAQAYALAKRAAIADGYRLIAEKIKGVEVEGQDIVKNMMVKRSSIRTAVSAIVKNANVVETKFRDGLCEVEMEIKLSYDDFAQ